MQSKKLEMKIINQSRQEPYQEAKSPDLGTIESSTKPSSSQCMAKHAVGRAC